MFKSVLWAQGICCRELYKEEEKYVILTHHWQAFKLNCSTGKEEIVPWGIIMQTETMILKEIIVKCKNVDVFKQARRDNAESFRNWLLQLVLWVYSTSTNPF